MQNLCLKVSWNDYTTSEGAWVRDFSWRVQVYCVGSEFEHPDYPWQNVPEAEFVRRKDAEIALQSLLDAGLDTAEKIGQRRGDLRRVMCENLQW